MMYLLSLSPAKRPPSCCLVNGRSETAEGVTGRKRAGKAGDDFPTPQGVFRFFPFPLPLGGLCAGERVPFL